MTDPRPAHPIDDLLAHAGWVRSLAWDLLHDETRVEDVVQRTWLAALQAPPRDPSRVRAWLRRVVRNAAFEDLRGESARRARERLVARPSKEDAVPDVFARAESHRQLVDAVAALPPALGEAVLLRYFEGVPPREIARRLGVPLETVKSRLKRGLEALREDYRTRAEADGRDWRMLLVPVVGREGLPTLVGRAGGGAGRAVRPRVLFAAALVVAVATGAALTTTRPPDAGGSAGAGTATESSARQIAERVAQARARRPAAHEAESPETRSDGGAPSVAAEDPAAGATLDPASTAGRPSARVRVRLVGAAARLADEVPLAVHPLLGAVVAARPDPVAAVARRGTADVDLTERVRADPRIVGAEVVVAHPDLVPTRTRVSFARDRTAGAADAALELVPAAPFVGRVLDDTGAPASGALTASFVVADGVARSLEESAAAADGLFRLRLRPGMVQWVVVTAPGRPAQVLTVVPPAAPAPATDPVIVHLERGHVLDGRIVDRTGAPVTSGSVRLAQPRLPTTLAVGSRGFTSDGSAVAAEGLTCALDGDGRFRFEGLAPGPHVLRPHVPGLTGGLAKRLQREVVVPCEPPVVRIDAGTIDVHVRGPAGPVAARGHVAGEGASSGVVADADGRLHVLGAPGEKLRIELSAEGFLPAVREVVVPAAGASSSVAIDLEARVVAGWEGTLVGRAANEVTVVGVELRRDGAAGLDAAQPTFRDVPVVDGRFRLPDLDPGAWRVAVRPGGWADPRGRHAQVEFVVDLQPSQTVRSEVALVPAGRLRLAVRDAAGRWVAAAVHVSDADGNDLPVELAWSDPGGTSMVGAATSDRGAADVFPALVPGSYRVTVRHAEVTAERIVQVRTGNVSEVVIDLP